MHYGDAAALHKYSALLRPRPRIIMGQVYNSAIIPETAAFTAKIHECVRTNRVRHVKNIGARARTLLNGHVVYIKVYKSIRSSMFIILTLEFRRVIRALESIC